MTMLNEPVSQSLKWDRLLVGDKIRVNCHSGSPSSMTVGQTKIFADVRIDSAVKLANLVKFMV